MKKANRPGHLFHRDGNDSGLDWPWLALWDPLLALPLVLMCVVGHHSLVHGANEFQHDHAVAANGYDELVADLDSLLLLLIRDQACQLLL